jgi:hypothetical protein
LKKDLRKIIRYKKQFDDSNAPFLHKTPEGYKLGNGKLTREKLLIKANSTRKEFRGLRK